jgi:hypothetical protein
LDGELPADGKVELRMNTFDTFRFEMDSVNLMNTVNADFGRWICKGLLFCIRSSALPSAGSEFDCRSIASNGCNHPIGLPQNR